MHSRTSTNNGTEMCKHFSEEVKENRSTSRVRGEGMNENGGDCQCERPRDRDEWRREEAQWKPHWQSHALQLRNITVLRPTLHFNSSLLD